VYAAQYLLEAKDRGQKISPAMLASLDEWLTRFASTPAPSLADGRWRLMRCISWRGRESSRRMGSPVWSRSCRTGIRKTGQRILRGMVGRHLPAHAARRRCRAQSSRRFRGRGKNATWARRLITTLWCMTRNYSTCWRGTSRRGWRGAAHVLEDLGSAVSGNRLNSLSAAWTLLALDAYAKAAGATGKLGTAEIAKDGANVRCLCRRGDAEAAVSTDASKVQFSKEGALAAYYSLNESGFDRIAPTAAVNQGVEVIREFLDLKGNPIAKVKVGEEFLIRVRLRATTRDRVSQIALEDLLPGGTEAVLELRPPRIAARRARILLLLATGALLGALDRAAG